MADVATNVVTVVFDVESEAYKAFSELRAQPVGEGYNVAEASLIKREGDTIKVADGFDAAGTSGDDTAAGMVIGAFVGVLGGPIGVLLGAGIGSLIGNAKDSKDADDSLSMLEVTVSKLYDGEVAIVALLQEEEPAFDAVFAEYKTTIYRQYAEDVKKEVELAREKAKDFENQLRGELQAEKKAAKEARKAERAEKRAERKAEFDEAKDIANAQFTSSTKEAMGTEDK